MVKFFLGLFVGLVVGSGATLGIVVLARATGPQHAAASDKPPTPTPVAAPAPYSFEQSRQQLQRVNSNDQRINSVASTLQTMRGQIELFKIQHADVAPAPTALATVLTGKTNPRDTTRSVTTGTLGPYVQHMPVNPINGWNGVTTVANPGYGWVYNADGATYTMQGVNGDGSGVLTY